MTNKKKPYSDSRWYGTPDEWEFVDGHLTEAEKRKLQDEAKEILKDIDRKIKEEKKYKDSGEQ